MEYKQLNEELVNYILMLNKFFNDNHISIKEEENHYLINSDNKKCDFILDMHRGGRYSNRIVLNLRYKRSDEMVFRLEIDGKPHVNPDGTVTDRDHVHIIKFDGDNITEYGLSLKDFHDIIVKNTSDVCEVFEVFCNYNKIQVPEYQKVM